MTLEGYLQHRRKFEIAFWMLYFVTYWITNSTIVIMEIARLDLEFAHWEPVVWEGSSLLAQAALIPVVLWWERLFPIRFGRLRRGLIIHTLLTLPWSLIHVTAMVATRELAYWLQGGNYDFGHWPTELLYEYLKDFRTYAFFLALIYLYRFILLRLRGEASLLARPDEGEPVEPVERPRRLLVKKFGKEFLVNVRDIEWLEAAGNYVNLHVANRVYPLRETMSNLGRRLDPDKFVRVHRSHMVNLDFVAEIAPLETGDARLSLTSGKQVPVSRRYRDELRDSLG